MALPVVLRQPSCGARDIARETKSQAALLFLLPALERLQLSDARPHLLDLNILVDYHSISDD